MICEISYPEKRFDYLIKKFFFLKGKNNNDRIEDKSISDGYSWLVINFKETATLVLPNSEIKLPDIFYIKPLAEEIKIRTSEPYDIMGVVMYTSVFSRIFQVDFSGSGYFYDGNPLFSNDIYMILKKASFTERIQIFTDFLIARSESEKYFPDEIDEVYYKIISSSATDSYKNIYNNLRMNERTFRRKFIQRVGLNAKALLRLIRINNVWQEVKNKTNLDSQDIIYLAKYCDQAHFINDFKKITGETPRHFFNRDLNNAEIMSVKNWINNR